MRTEFANKPEPQFLHKRSTSPKKSEGSIFPIHPADKFQQTIGNQGVLRRCESRQLRVNEPSDRYEQEAVRVADQVMCMPSSVSRFERAPVIQRKPTSELSSSELNKRNKQSSSTSIGQLQSDSGTHNFSNRQGQALLNSQGTGSPLSSSEPLERTPSLTSRTDTQSNL